MTVNLTSKLGTVLPKPVETVSAPKPQTPPAAPATATPVQKAVDTFQAAASRPQEQWAASFASGAASLAGSAVTGAEASFKAGTVEAAQAAKGAINPGLATDEEVVEAAVVAKDTLAATGSVKAAEEAVATKIPLIPQAAVKMLVNALNNNRNVVADENRANGGWERSSQVVKQSGNENCGAAAVATLASATGDTSVTNEQRMNELTQQFGTGEGATPAQVSEMLTAQGLKVTSGDATLDEQALDTSLRQGGKAMVMVDSNLVNPATQDQGPGTPHWVVVDGMDKEGNYLVKDPGTGGSYYVSPEQLGTSMEATRESTGGGGILTVEKQKADETREDAKQQSRENADKIGHTPGKGSNSRRAGRETSDGW